MSMNLKEALEKEEGRNPGRKGGKKSFRQRSDRMCFRSQGNQNPGAAQLRFL